MTPMCDEPMCCVNVIVNGNVVSIGFLSTTYGTEHRKDLLSTQMSTAIQRHAPEVLPLLTSPCPLSLRILLTCVRPGYGASIAP